MIPVRLIDVHTHLETPVFDPVIEKVIRDAREAGVIKMITSSVTSGEWHRSRELAERFKEVEYTPGIHPWFVHNENIETVIPALEHELTHGAIGIGEIGLDKMINEPGLPMQIPFFEDQLALAREKNLPVIIHCRKAYNELYQSIKRTGMPEAGGIIHSFAGSRELAETFVPLGIKFSLGGILTYPGSEKRKRMLEYIYPDHFMLETDSPEILPVVPEEEGGPLTQPTVPAYIIYNLRAAADILDRPALEVAHTTVTNARKMFNI